MGGRRPKPTWLKELAGNPGRRPLPENELRPEQKAPDCPDWLSDEAKAKWRELAPRLERLGLLTELDGDALAVYCDRWATWRAAEEDIKQHGASFTTEKGYEGPRPIVKIAERAMKDLLRLGREFGFTPSSRTGIELPPPPDPFDEFFTDSRCNRKGEETDHSF